LRGVNREEHPLTSLWLWCGVSFVHAEERALDAKRRVATAFGALFHDMRRTLDGEVGAWEREALRAWTARGSRLADELLAVAGAQPLAAAAVDAKPLLHALARDVRRALDLRIEIVVHVANDCPACLADPVALRTALLALVANARDALPDGGVIVLRADPTVLVDGSPAVQWSVHDEGGGIARELRETAMHPFATTKAGRTAGLGLAAADGFARQSGGELRLESSSAGTACRLVLPAQASSPKRS
jgi:signal transduction histidine kinase